MADNAISFGQIPRTSRLYNDFLYNFDRVSRFYQSSGLDISALAARAQKVTAQTFSRDAVADALADQNARAGPGVLIGERVSHGVARERATSSKRFRGRHYG